MHEGCLYPWIIPLAPTRPKRLARDHEKVSELRSVWQISMGQLFMLVTLPAIYLGVRGMPIPFSAKLYLIGYAFNVATTATFFFLDRPGAGTKPSWIQVIRNIAIGTLSGIVPGLEIIPYLRWMRYLAWSEDWIYYAGWVAGQLMIAASTYAACCAVMVWYKSRRTRPNRG